MYNEVCDRVDFSNHSLVFFIWWQGIQTYSGKIDPIQGITIESTCCEYRGLKSFHFGVIESA